MLILVEGGSVKVLQQFFNSKNRNKIEVDGGIGPNTLNLFKNISLDRVRKIQSFKIFKHSYR